MEGNDVSCSIVSSMEKIFPHSVINENQQSRIVIAGEEHFFQIVFCNQTEFTIQFAKLNIVSKIKERVVVSAIDYVPLTSLSGSKIDDYFDTNEIGLVPDKIRPFRATDLCLYSHENKACFVSIDTKGLQEGEYSVIFVLESNDTKYVEKSYSFQVVDYTMPAIDLKLTNWIHYDCISNYHSVKLFTEEFYNVFEHYINEYVDIGYNTLFTPLFTPPLDTYIGGERETAQLIKIKRCNGNYTFEFDELEKFIDFAFAHGIKYIEFSHLFTQWGVNCCPKIICEENGQNKRIFGWDTVFDSDEYIEFLNCFLPCLVEFIKNKDIEDSCYFHLTDEPSLKDIDKYEKCRSIVKRHIESMKILDAISEVKFFERKLVDIPVAIVDSFDKFRGIDSNEIFVYYSCCTTNNYYTNRLLYMPLQRTRILGLQLYINNITGFLHWGFNFYNSALSYYSIDPNFETDSGSMLPSGDGFIVYPNRLTGEVYSSLRAKAIKSAFYDYRLLCALEKEMGKDFVIELLQTNGVDGFSLYPRSFSWHEEFIAKIKDLIKSKKQ